MVEAQQYNIKNYSVWDGLAQSQVYDVIEDTQGNIWMATWGGGISKFDGINFHTISKANGLGSNYVESLHRDEETIWIGTKAGLTEYNGKSFKSYYLLPDSVPVRVHDATTDAQGKVWVATESGLYTFFNSRFEQITDNETWCVIAANNDIWYGTDQGLHVIREGKEVTYTRDDGLSYRKVRALAFDMDGNLLVGTYGGGLDKWDGVKFTQLYSDAIVHGIELDEAGNIWLATLRNGAIRLNVSDSTASVINETEGIANNHIRCVMQDSWGNVWIGSSGGGISKYMGQTFVHYTERNGLADNYVYSVLEDSLGRLWMGTGSKGISRLDSSGWTYLNADSGFFNVKSKAIFEDSKGNIWLGTEGKGIVRYNDSTFRVFTGNDGLSDPWIWKIDEDSKGRIWVATAGGGISILEFDTTDQVTITTILKSDGLVSNELRNLHIDTNDVAWYGSDDAGMGYVRLDSNGLVTQAVPGIESNNIVSIAEDSFGYLWVGTAGDGVSRISIYEKRPEVHRFTQEDGLASNGVFLIAFDSDQNLWVGTEKGIDLISLDIERNISSVKHFGQAEGFVGVETCRNAVELDRNGNLWFGTINGLTRYNPNKQKSNAVPPKISITGISLFYQQLEQTDYANCIGAWGNQVKDIVMPYNQNHLGFEFFGVNHSNPTRVQYQWKLAGYDEGWTPVNQRTNTNYSNLQPGSYTFMVRSCNEDGVWNSKPATISFTILPPYWQTWWFRLAVVAGSILVLVLIFNWRLRAYRAKSKRIRERLKLEKEMVQLEQKALRLQMNPHFIFNSLNSIQGLITKKDEKSARFFLAKFSKLMRQILENSREATITLEDEMATLENYMALEQFSKGESFDYEILLGEGVHPELIDVPPMMIQPFIENAIIHGLKNIEHKGRIKVRFELAENHLACTITDNGIGRKKAAENKAQQEARHKSTALIVTQERLDRLSTEFNHESLSIIDLEDDTGSSLGTKVVIRIPF